LQGNGDQVVGLVFAEIEVNGLTDIPGGVGGDGEGYGFEDESVRAGIHAVLGDDVVGFNRGVQGGIELQSDLVVRVDGRGG
jgi:hypothetical protein